MQVPVISKDGKREYTLILNNLCCTSKSNGWYVYITTSTATAVFVRMRPQTPYCDDSMYWQSALQQLTDTMEMN